MKKELSIIMTAIMCCCLNAQPDAHAQQGYSYDSLNRLIRHDFPEGYTVYQYDEVGNRTDLESVRVYEDAEDGLTVGWIVYDDVPSGATISNILDVDRQSNVIEFSGSGSENSYLLLTANEQNWNNQTQFVLSWSQRYAVDYWVYVSVDTTDGERFLCYSPTDENIFGFSPLLYLGLGTESIDNQWHDYARDLEADIHEAEPTVDIVAVNSFLIYGSGRIDEIQLLNTLPTDVDSDNDGLTNSEELAYGTNPYKADSDEDGISDAAEIDFWGLEWNLDFDGDGLSNILDYDSDNDGASDGYEISTGTDPSDPTSRKWEVIVLPDGFIIPF